MTNLVIGDVSVTAHWKKKKVTIKCNTGPYIYSYFCKQQFDDFF